MPKMNKNELRAIAIANGNIKPGAPIAYVAGSKENKELSRKLAIQQRAMMCKTVKDGKKEKQ